jgi:hypothetical protein
MTIKSQKKKIKTLQEQLDAHQEARVLARQEVLLVQELEKALAKKTISWKKEAPYIKQLATSGKTLREIGEIYGVSREHIRQVLKRYFPELSAESRGKALLITKEKERRLAALYARTGRTTERHETDLSRAMARCYSRKKQNVKSGKWEWTLSPTDLDYPIVCPMLGIEIDWFAESTQENSPSIDRIDSTKGYIPGNVQICSWRANRIKNDGTASELRKIADYLDSIAEKHLHSIDSQVLSVV